MGFSAQFQKTYLKVILIYSLFMIAIILISSMIMISYSNTNLQKEILRSNIQRLRQVQIYLDDTIVQNAYNRIVTDFFVMSNDLNISDYFLYDTSDFYKLLRLRQYLSQIALSDVNIHSLFAYRKRDDSVISSFIGINFVGVNGMGRDNIVGFKDIVNRINGSKSRSGWISWRYRGEQKALLLSYYCKVPISAPNNQIGFILINFDKVMILKEIKKFLPLGNLGFFITGVKNEILLNKPINNFTSLLKTPLPNNKRTQGYLLANVKGQETALMWIKSAKSNLYYKLIVPLRVLNRQVVLSKRIMILITFLVIVFSLFLLDVLTLFIYRPLQRIISLVRKLANKKVIEDELGFVNSYINYLSKHVREMEEVINKNKELNRYKFILDVIYGRVKEEDEIEKRYPLIGTALKGDFFGILIIRISERKLSLLSMEVKELVTYEIITRVKKFIRSYRGKSLSTVHPPSDVVTVFSCYDYSKIENSLELLFDSIDNRLHSSIDIAISPPRESLINLWMEYKKTIDFFKYIFIYGHGNIFTGHTIKRLEQNEISLGINYFNHLNGLVRCGSFEELKDEISKISHNARKEEYSIYSVRDFFIQVIDMLSNAVEEQDMEDVRLSKNIMREEFENLETMDEAVSWLYDKIDLFRSFFDLKKSDFYRNFIERVKNYIEENLDSQMTLSSVAYHFNISPGHLSRLFKEYSEMCFADFLKKKKMEKAAYMLRVKKDISVNNVARSIGYFTPSYFSKVFKEVYGVTPGHYRREHSEGY